jgi:hypothetical protein
MPSSSRKHFVSADSVVWAESQPCSAVRNAVQAASYGQNASIDFYTIAGSLYPRGFAHGWQAVPCVENHDIVKVGTDLRIPALADGSNHESW